MSLRIAETNTSMYHYHLVRKKIDAIRQGELEGICGKKFGGWETMIPVRVWGMKDHLPSHWCAGCTEALEKEPQCDC